eukprot:3028729-Prymnesium_polylepis.1
MPLGGPDPGPEASWWLCCYPAWQRCDHRRRTLCVALHASARRPRRKLLCTRSARKGAVTEPMAVCSARASDSS